MSEKRSCASMTAAGLPCPANALRASDPDGLHRCPQHTTDPVMALKVAESRRDAWRARRLVLPENLKRPVFSSREAITRWCEDMARRVLIGQVDPRLSAEARGCAMLALQARTAEAQERLVEALLRVEHGGAAMAMLLRLQEGITAGPRRPLPGRLTPAPASEGDAA